MLCGVERFISLSLKSLLCFEAGFKFWVELFDVLMREISPLAS